MISSELKRLVSSNNLDLDTMDLWGGQIIFVEGSHGTALFRRSDGAFLDATPCGCADGPDCYRKYASMNVGELMDWTRGNERAYIYATGPTIDFLDVELTQVDGRIINPDYEYRRARFG